MMFKKREEMAWRAGQASAACSELNHKLRLLPYFWDNGYPTNINIQHSINETEDEDESKKCESKLFSCTFFFHVNSIYGSHIHSSLFVWHWNSTHYYDKVMVHAYSHRLQNS
jgi:hypothetical protein